MKACVQRNFGGYEGSVKSFETEINYFDKAYSQSIGINMTECIKENILDNESRYLMVISDTSRSQHLIQFLLKSLNKQNSFLLGSHFEKDLKSEEYITSLLQKIQVSMKVGEIIIMNNLESLYPSLYDLFNQTLTQVCGRKYSRITIGSSTESIFEVNDNFKCIVLVDKNKLNTQDRPFLSRFEKQLFYFKDLLNQNENKYAKDIYNILKEIIVPISDNYKRANKIDISSHLINFSLEEISAIVYDNKEKEFNEIKKEVFNKIVPILTQDIMVNIYYSSFYNKYKKEFNEISKIYEKKPNNFNDLINKIKNGEIQNHKNVIYTFSRIFDGLMDDESEIDNKIISNYDYEKLIHDFIHKFYNSNKKFMVIQIKEELSEHLNHLLNIIDIYTKNNNIPVSGKYEDLKYVIIIVYLQREIFYTLDNKPKEKNFISFLSSYNQMLIDNLKGENISIVELYDLTNDKLFNLKYNENNNIKIFFDKEKEFKTLLYQGFMRFSYKFLNKLNDKITEENYHEEATRSLKTGNQYLQTIQDRIIQIICNEEKNNKNLESIILLIITDNDYQQKGIDFISDIKNYMRKLLLEYFIKFIYKSERDAVLPSILFPNNKNDSKEINQNLKDYIENLNFGYVNPSYEIRGNTVNVIFGINLPLIYPFLYNLRIFGSSMKSDFIKNEIRIRRGIINETMKNKRSQILTKIQKQFIDNKFFNKNDIGKDDMEIFYSDFRKIFIFENINNQKTKINYELLLKIFLKIKFGDDLLLYEKIGEIVFWIECHNDFIIDIFNICGELDINLELFEEKVTTLINNKLNENDDEINEKINASEPFNSIIEFLCCYIIENSELFSKKNGAFEYLSELIINDTSNYYIESRLIFLLKSCVETYKNISNNIFTIYIEEVKKEIINFNNKNYDEIKKNWESQLNILEKELDSNKEYIVSLYIYKYREVSNLEFRKYLIEQIINNEKLLPFSQRFFFLILSIYNLEIEPSDINSGGKKSYLVFNGAKNDDFLIFIDEKISEKNEKAKILTEIILYYFESHLIFDENRIGEYSYIIKYLIAAIENDDNIENNYIIYPYLTRIFASAFLKKYLEFYINAIYKKLQNKGNVKIFDGSFENRKLLWKYVEILMGKILYFNILKKDFNKFKNEAKNENMNKYLNNIIESNNDENIKILLESKIDDNYKYDSLNFVSSLVNLNDFKQHIKENENEYPVLSSLIEEYEKSEKGKSGIIKLKNIITINEFENPLLHYFNYSKSISRNEAKEMNIENVIGNLKSTIDISEKYKNFKKCWNEEFMNFVKSSVTQIKQTSKLEEVLMDQKKYSKGKQLSDIYESLINVQNSFIEKIIEKRI